MSDAVNSPSHYNVGKIEVAEFVEDQGLGYHLGNVLKYVCRAGRKDPSKEVEDLEKAKWYLERRIELLKAAKEGRAPLRPNAMNRKKPELPLEIRVDEVGKRWDSKTPNVQEIPKSILEVLIDECENYPKELWPPASPRRWSKSVFTSAIPASPSEFPEHPSDTAKPALQPYQRSFIERLKRDLHEFGCSVLPRDRPIALKGRQPSPALYDEVQTPGASSIPYGGQRKGRVFIAGEDPCDVCKVKAVPITVCGMSNGTIGVFCDRCLPKSFGCPAGPGDRKLCSRRDCTPCRLADPAAQ